MRIGLILKWCALGLLAAGSFAPLCGCSKGPVEKPDELQQGLGLLRLGDYEGALHKLERAAQATPGNATAQFNLGIVYWKLGRPDPALATLRKAAEINPGDPRPLQFLGRLLIGQQSWNEAHDVLKRMNEISPDSPWTLTSLAMIAFHRGENLNTQLLLAKALGADPAYPPALYNMAIFSRDRINQPEVAADLFRRYLAVGGDDAHVAKAKTSLEALTKPPVQTQAPVALKPQPPPREAVKPAPLQPPTSPQPPSPPQAPAPVIAERNTAPVPPEAPAPKPPPPAPVRAPPAAGDERAAAQLISRAQRAIEREAFDEALILLQEAAGLKPPVADALWQLSDLYSRHLGYSDKAREVQARLRAEFPDDPRVQKASVVKPPARMATAREAWGAGQLCHKEGDLTRAALYYRRTLELDPRHTDAAYNLGLILKSEGKLAAARDAFQQSLRYHADHAEAGYMLASLYRELKEPGKAISQAKKTLHAKPEYAAAHLLLGLLYMDQRDYASARDQFALAVQTAPDAQFAEKARAYMLNAGRARPKPR